MIAYCYENLMDLKKSLKYHIKAAEIRKNDVGIYDQKTKKSVKNSLKLAKQLKKENELPKWIKELNDQ